MSQAPKLSLTRYHVTFGIGLVVLTVALGALKYFLEMSTLGVSFVLPFLTSTFVGEQFIKRQQRLPIASEKKRLIVGGLIIFAALNLLFLLAAWAGGLFEGLASGATSTIFAITLILLVIGIVINYFLMRWAYGSLLSKRAEKLNIDISNTF